MKHWYMIVVMSLLVSGCIGAGHNVSLESENKGYFPSILGINLHGEDVRVPEALSSGYKIITIGFIREHQEAINTWIPVADDLIRAHDDVSFYELPIIHPMNTISRLWLNNAMRAGIQEDKARERTITIYTDRERFLNLMDMQVEHAYVLVLNEEGQIVWRWKGPANNEAVESLEQIISGTVL